MFYVVVEPKEIRKCPVTYVPFRWAAIKIFSVSLVFRLVQLYHNQTLNLLFLVKILLNTATCDCGFVNLNPIVTTLHIIWQTMIQSTSHTIFFAMQNFARKVCVSIVTKICVLLNWLVQSKYRVIHHYSMIHHSKAFNFYSQTARLSLQNDTELQRCNGEVSRCECF